MNPGLTAAFRVDLLSPAAAKEFADSPAQEIEAQSCASRKTSNLLRARLAKAMADLEILAGAPLHIVCGTEEISRRTCSRRGSHRIFELLSYAAPPTSSERPNLSRRNRNIITIFIAMRLPTNGGF